MAGRLRKQLRNHQPSVLDMPWWQNKETMKADLMGWKTAIKQALAHSEKYFRMMVLSMKLLLE